MIIKKLIDEAKSYIDEAKSFKNEHEFTHVPSASGSAPFRTVTQLAVDELESITATEKAQAVPYLKIWEVDKKTGKPIHHDPNDKSFAPSAPLSMQLVAPPRFGMPVGSGRTAEFRERPDVSLEQITIKTDTKRGIFIFRYIDFSFIVHRPEVIFDVADKNRDNWASILFPGSVFAMEYGWKSSLGVKNGIINGLGINGENEKPSFAVPGVSTIRFTVFNYNFTIKPNNEIAINVQAIEDSELNLRKKVFNNALKLQLKLLNLKGEKNANDFVTFKEIIDKIFADEIVDSYISFGYKNVKLLIFDFNKNVGKTVKKYGGDNLCGKSIGDFRFQISEIEKLFGDLMKNNEITLNNCLFTFINYIMQSTSWEKTDGIKYQKTPLIMIKSVPNKGGSVLFHIFDAREQFTHKLKDDELLTTDATREQIREKLDELNIPMISFRHGNSYISDSSFEVNSDPRIADILMSRANRTTHGEIISETNIAKKKKPSNKKPFDKELEEKIKIANKEYNKLYEEHQMHLKSRNVSPLTVLYSSAITGNISMIGNFVFDTFALVWLDFGVTSWSGPFYIDGRQDVIGPGGWTTTISFTSAGDDPLGTQGRRTGATRSIEEAKAKLDALNKELDDKKKAAAIKAAKNKKAAAAAAEAADAADAADSDEQKLAIVNSIIGAK